MPVDTHVHRVARRLGIIGEKVTADQAHPLLTELAGRGRRRRRSTPCTWTSCGTAAASATPGGRACGECPLAGMCPSAGLVQSAARGRRPAPRQTPAAQPRSSGRASAAAWPPPSRTRCPGPRPCPSQRSSRCVFHTSRQSWLQTNASAEEHEVLPPRQRRDLEERAPERHGEHDDHAERTGSRRRRPCASRCAPRARRRPTTWSAARSAG